MVIVAVKPKIKEEFIEDYINLFEEVQKHVLNEMGCYDYNLNIDTVTGELFLFERWECQDDISAHLETEHMKKYFEKTAHMKEVDAEVSFYNVENFEDMEDED